VYFLRNFKLASPVLQISVVTYCDSLLLTQKVFLFGWLKKFGNNCPVFRQNLPSDGFGIGQKPSYSDE